MINTYRYALRHNETGNIFCLKQYGGTKLSYWEGEECEGEIKLYATKRSANLAIIQWARGHHKNKWEAAEYPFDDGYTVHEVTPVEGRNRNQLSVVTLRLIEILNPKHANHTDPNQT